MNTVTVKLRYLRMTARKTRAMAGIIRGLPVNEAEAQLMLASRRAAKPLLKLLRSAIANAKAANLDPDAMSVKTIMVDGGPMIKRFLPRARGVASPIQRKMSHVTLTLAESDKKKAKRFIIIVPKKSKKDREKEGGKRDHSKKEEREGRTTAASGEKSFMKKIFRRKVGE